DQCHGELLQNLQIPLLFLAASRTVKLPLEEARFWTTHAPKARLETVDSASQGLAFAKADDCARRALSFLLEQCRWSLDFDHVCVGGASVAAGRFAMPSSTA